MFDNMESYNMAQTPLRGPSFLEEGRPSDTFVCRLTCPICELPGIWHLQIGYQLAVTNV